MGRTLYATISVVAIAVLRGFAGAKRPWSVCLQAFGGLRASAETESPQEFSLVGLVRRGLTKDESLMLPFDGPIYAPVRP
ncbi:MAG TPA: hypothetical protein VGS59_04430 [Candidatus Acidoferrales bacterium]|nr:hypothetical protein [Candidatus Acidoferrales bacterium]